MIPRCLLFTIIMSASQFIFAQSDSLAKASSFERITKEIAAFKPDTLDPPDDKITKKIIELRSLRGGFNINEAIEFKIEEDRQDQHLSQDNLDKLSTFFTTGNGRKQLDNAVIWIYRTHFTYKEIKGLVRFYKTRAGQKWARDFPVIMLESLAAAEIIKSNFSNQGAK